MYATEERYFGEFKKNHPYVQPNISRHKENRAEMQSDFKTNQNAPSWTIKNSSKIYRDHSPFCMTRRHARFPRRSGNTNFLHRIC